MPEPTLYAIDHQRLTEFVVGVRGILAGRDVGAWQEFFAQLQAAEHSTVSLFVPNGVPRVGSFRSKPGHTDGLPDLSADDVPSMDSPSLQQVLRQITLASAKYRYVGTWGRFNHFFGSELERKPYADFLADPTVREGYDLWLGTMLRPVSPLPPEFAFLQNPDAYHSYVPPARIDDLVEAEDRCGLLDALIEGFQALGNEEGKLFSTELLRLDLFVRLVQLDGLSLYYEEYAT